MNRTTLMATHTYAHRFLISQLNTNAGMVPELQRENEELKARNRDLQLEIDELKARVRRERSLTLSRACGSRSNNDGSISLYRV